MNCDLTTDEERCVGDCEWKDSGCVEKKKKTFFVWMVTMRGLSAREKAEKGIVWLAVVLGSYVVARTVWIHVIRGLFEVPDVAASKQKNVSPQ